MTSARLKLHTLQRLIGYLFLCLILASCLNLPKRVDAPSFDADAIHAQALQAVAAGDIAAALLLYDKLAAGVTDPQQRQSYQLDAIELLLDASRGQEAGQRLRALVPPLATTQLQWRRQLADAHYTLLNGQPQEALKRLPRDDHSLPTELRVRAARLQIQLYTALSDAQNVLRSRIELSALLPQEERQENDREIWQHLAERSDIQLASLYNPANGTTYNGWVELAQIVRNTRQQSGRLENTLPIWQQRFPTHPANDLIAWLIEQQPRQVAISAGQQIALLLPLSGKLGAVSTSVRDGFFAAYYSDAEDQRPNIRVYDVGNPQVDVLRYYSQAVNDGAQLVVGPLAKNALSQLATQSVLAVPTIALNYLADPHVQTPQNLFQYGLLPEDEARATVEFALGRGQRRAIALVPNNTWGERMLNAFSQHLHAGGGQLLASKLLSTESYDFSQPLKQILRYRGSSSGGRPSRRRDIDFIFLAVTAEMARQIKPQLNYFYAGNLPTYSTSRIFNVSSEPDKDIDLNGIFFCDIPWLLTDALVKSPLYREVNRNWSQKNRLSRLYAMGIDAYALAKQFPTIRNNPQVLIDGRSGQLSLQHQRRFRRGLDWAQFVNGLPLPLRKPSSAEDPVNNGLVPIGDG